MKSEINKPHINDSERGKIRERAEIEDQIREPGLFKIIMHNDDFTPMDFVITMLERFFHMDRRRASEVMLEVHMKGMAACGFYTKDIAETKISLVVDYARSHEHPLICSMELAG
jgi:ATP-dependent Clp protease adaptor protein ClpS